MIGIIALITIIATSSINTFINKQTFDRLRLTEECYAYLKQRIEFLEKKLLIEVGDKNE